VCYVGQFPLQFLEPCSPCLALSILGGNDLLDARLHMMSFLRISMIASVRFAEASDWCLNEEGGKSALLVQFV